MLREPNIAPLQAAFRSTIYRIERVLGQGGMATVYLARDTKHGRPVAVKILRPDVTSALAPTRFRREIAIAATLSHPHIVPVLDSGIMPTGELWFAMPYVEGESLRQRLQREGALPIRAVVRITREVAEALEYAHRRGIVHRDIKPENILLAGGAAAVADFGVAKAIAYAATEEGAPSADTGGEAQSTALTGLGVALGTPAYMSPEQAVGDPSTDARTDVYALGTVAYEMLTGAAPFAGLAPHALTAAKLTGAPAPLADARSDCPPALAALVTRCLDADPAGRPQSAGAVARALEDLSLARTADRSVEAARGAGRAGRRLRWVMVAVGLVAAGSLGVAATLRTRSKPATPRPVAMAVLPFDYIGGDSTQRYFSDGITEELTAQLSRVSGLTLAAHSSAFAFPGHPVDLAAVGRKLGVDRVVQGRVARLGHRVRISAELDNTRDGRLITTTTMERDADDLVQLQTGVATALVQALEPALATARIARSTSRAVPQRAYDLYLQGRYLAGHETRDALLNAIDSYRRATVVDPSFANAYSATARAYSELADAFMPPSEAYPLAIAAARHAIALDSTLAEAHSVLGTVLLSYQQGSVREAKAELDRALALNPSDVDARYGLGLYYTLTHAPATQLATLAREIVRLDPLRPNPYDFAITSFALSREPDSSIAYDRLQRALDSGYAYIDAWVDEAYRLKGRYDAALAADERASRLLGHPTPGTVITLARMGRVDQARRTLMAIESWSQQHYVPPELIARDWLALGDEAKALHYLEMGMQQHSLFAWSARYFGEFRAVEHDPRFADWERYLDSPRSASCTRC